ncbi:CTL-like protein [Glycine soja]|nr:CTL-like protein [Glycine max]KAH1265357.1 CTL-like protein [Glycine max]
MEQQRRWHDVFWLGIFVIHLVGMGLVLGVLGLNRFKQKNRLDIDKYTYRFMENEAGLTEDYWPLYAVAGGLGTALGWSWLLLLGSRATQMMKVSVHILTTYLAVISVLCFWAEQFFWGVAFAIGAALQFLYVISVIERLPFTMLVLQKAVKMVWNIPEVMRVAYAFMLVVLLWMALWSFGAAGVVASSMGDGGRWWLLVVLSISLFWTGAVLCNTVHVIVSGTVVLVSIHGGREAVSIPANSFMKCLQYALTTSFGSICYGSLFTAAIRTLRWEMVSTRGMDARVEFLECRFEGLLAMRENWEKSREEDRQKRVEIRRQLNELVETIRGIRSRIGNNECLLCCVDFVFHLVETLVRFFNKYAYVQIAVYGKSFNRSARDAWELFQSTGVETLVAYDCSGAVLLMGTIFGGLITGTCSGVWAWIKWNDRAFMIGSTSMLMGMILVGVAMVVVESAVTSIYICYAEDPLLIQRWDTEFFNQMSETLHQRLQHRSSRGAREVLTHDQLDSHASI